MLNRRNFLQSCAASAGMLTAAGGTIFERILAAEREVAGISPEQVASNEDFWFLIQQAFTEDRNIINLNNGTIQSGLRIVQDAVRRHNEFSANAAAHSMMILAKEIESCRRRLALHLGCDSEELVICRSGTEAGQIPIMGLDLQRGDEVIITNMDYPKLISSWKQREKREGIVVKMVALPAPPVKLDRILPSDRTTGNRENKADSRVSYDALDRPDGARPPHFGHGACEGYRSARRRSAWLHAHTLQTQRSRLRLLYRKPAQVADGAAGKWLRTHPQKQN